MLDNFSPQSYTSIGRAHNGIRIGRSRSLGGTTNLWGGQLAEFQPVDFAGRQKERGVMYVRALSDQQTITEKPGHRPSSNPETLHTRFVPRLSVRWPGLDRW